ncbi:DUF2637 domain-containing protein [Streptomyces odontomachi]|uniref:DUF2637 domain-containing protein n=1 Tax=Streptomyces odontomachi TaxID=2944940 RepID=UPI00210D652E|nr:DUF2637 domain-containing protein [Streptomyces sp. ODS25]
MAAPLKLTRTHRILAGLVVTGGLVIAGIGFAGSYSAVRALAERQGFGAFAAVFPIGIDAGICVLLALDLLLTWIRIPFPLLRQTAWLLTAATIAFNGAAAWPDPLGVGMHAVIPVLFVVSVEAARHAVGRIADITADKHMEGVRLTRWLLSPVPTFLLWRRMKLWELRSYEQTIRLEQERLIYQARLHSRFGRAWRRKAPIESLMPLRLARYGVPLAETAPAGLAAAGIEPVLLPPGPTKAELERLDDRRAQRGRAAGRDDDQAAHPGAQESRQTGQSPWFSPPHQPAYGEDASPSYAPEEEYEQWYAEQQQQYPQEQPYARSYVDHAQPGHESRQVLQKPGRPTVDEAEVPYPEDAVDVPYPQGPGEPAPHTFRVPSGPGRTRPLGGNHVPIPGPRHEAVDGPGEQVPEPDGAEQPDASGLPGDLPRDEAFYQAFQRYLNEHMDFPNARQFGLYLQSLGETSQSGGPLPESTLRPYLKEFRDRYQLSDADAEHIA